MSSPFFLDNQGNTGVSSLRTLTSPELPNLRVSCRSVQVRITYEERHPGDWGGFRPKVVVEYDERNSFLMAIEITYNRREANKNFAYNYRELKDKIQQELDTAQVTAE